MGDKHIVTITPIAHAAIEYKVCYLATQRDVKAAIKLLEALKSCINAIQHSPAMAPTHRCAAYPEAEMRKHIVLEKYLLVYEIIKDKKQINILAFRSGQMR